MVSGASGPPISASPARRLPSGPGLQTRGRDRLSFLAVSLGFAALLSLGPRLSVPRPLSETRGHTQTFTSTPRLFARTNRTLPTHAHNSWFTSDDFVVLIDWHKIALVVPTTDHIDFLCLQHLCGVHYQNSVRVHCIINMGSIRLLGRHLYKSRQCRSRKTCYTPPHREAVIRDLVNNLPDKEMSKTLVFLYLGFKL